MTFVTHHKLAATERPKTLYEYVVTGTGFFPLDMLRYDGCWPADSESASYLMSPGLRKIKLLSYRQPTEARWNSFLWSIVQQ